MDTENSCRALAQGLLPNTIPLPGSSPLTFAVREEALRTHSAVLFIFSPSCFTPQKKQAQKLSRGAAWGKTLGAANWPRGSSWSSGVPAAMAESRGGREPPSACLVGELDTKQRPWFGGVRANHVARAKERRGPNAW